MEENEYRNTYHSVNPTQCVFEKSINSRRSQCSLAHRFCLADREGVSCTSNTAQQQCHGLLTVLREKARFAMKLTKVDGPLPHGKEVKVQMGSLLGLKKLLDIAGQENLEISDIHHLLDLAVKKYAGEENIPYDQIMQEVVRFEGRRKRAQRT